MEYTSARLTVNLSDKVRRVIENGTSYLVAPASILKQGVLPGSKGSLFYPQGEIDRTAQSWANVQRRPQARSCNATSSRPSTATLRQRS